MEEGGGGTAEEFPCWEKGKFLAACLSRIKIERAGGIFRFALRTDFFFCSIFSGLPLTRFV